MKKVLSVSLLLLGVLWSNFSTVQAQSIAAGAAEPYVARDSVTRAGFTVIFINKHKAFDESLKQKMIDVFFKVYPPMTKEFNAGSSKKVNFIIDPAYTGIAFASGNTVRFNPKWFDEHAKDVDVVTHEVMHIVQSYGRSGPSWITEGIADYVRYKYGVDNAGGGWSLTPFSAQHHYTNSYRITARFFVWIEKQTPGFVQKLDGHMRAHTYADTIWKELTGKMLDELWQQYAQNPSL